MIQASRSAMQHQDTAPAVAEPLADRLARARALLDRATPEPPRHLRLDWQDIRLDVTLTDAADGACVLRIAGCLGILPYTAENPAARRAALALLARLGGDPADRVRRDAHGAVWLDSRTLCPTPAGEADLTAAVVIVLLGLESRLLALCAELLPARAGIGPIAA